MYSTNADGSIYTYNTNIDGSINIAAYAGPPWAISIPNTIDGLPVSSIGEQAFYQCTSLTSVTIPASVTNIDIAGAAFENCPSLTAITVDATNAFYSSLNGVLFDKSQTTLVLFPGGLGGSYTIPASVTTIGAGAFFACEFGTCPSVASVTIPESVTSIGESAFEYCISLTSVTIPASVYSFGQGAFADCTGLTNVIFESGIRSTGESTFYFCTSLTSISIPSSVTSIGDGAFQECTSLGSVNIPVGVNTIGVVAFADCTSLMRVTIPSTVTNIGAAAFPACSSLTGVYFGGNAPVVGEGAFGQDNEATVYYLPGTTGWADFSTNGLPVVLWNPVIQSGGASFGVRTNHFGFNITGTANLVVVVEACSNLSTPVWAPLQTVTLTNGLFHFSDPQWTNYPARFYGLGFP
jgi:hypothetical protein